MPGTAVIDTYTINHQAWAPGMDVPFVIARVAVDGAPGVFLTTNIVGSPVDAVVIGDKVRAVFEQRSIAQRKKRGEGLKRNTGQLKRHFCIRTAGGR